MSKFVKSLMIKDLSSRLEGVNDLLVVDMVGLPAEASVALRRQFRQKNIHLMVVKNSLARRATEGTALAPAFATASGAMAVVWGGEDIVSLAKEVTAVAAAGKFKQFSAKGGVLDGAALSADEVKAVSKWPSRLEVLSQISGQILSPGATLSAQLLGPGKLLASQVKKKSEEEGAVEGAAEGAAEGAG